MVSIAGDTGARKGVSKMRVAIVYQISLAMILAAMAANPAIIKRGRVNVDRTLVTEDGIEDLVVMVLSPEFI